MDLHALHVRFTFWYISLPFSSWQRRKMIKFEVMWRTRAADGSQQLCSWNVYSHFPSRATWSNRKIIAVKGNNIFRKRSLSPLFRRLHIEKLCPTSQQWTVVGQRGVHGKHAQLLVETAFRLGVECVSTLHPKIAVTLVKEIQLRWSPAQSGDVVSIVTVFNS